MVINTESFEMHDQLPKTLKPLTWCFYVSGLLSRNVFKRYMPLAIYNLVTFSLLIIAMLQFIPNEREAFSVYSLEEFFGLGHILAKAVYIMFRWDNLFKLFQKTKQFWSLDRCDETMKRKLNFISDLIMRLQMFVLVVSTTVALSFVTFSLVNRKLVLGVWTLEGYRLLYIYTYVGQALISLYSLVVLFVVDSIFVAVCVEILIQFRILCYCLEELGKETDNKSNYLTELTVCIQHHQLILKFTKEFFRFYSPVLLIQYMISSPLICAELLGASAGASLTVVHHLVGFCYLFMELLYYCILVSIITNEAAQVANAVYASKWYEQNDTRLKAPVVMMVKGAQNEIKLLAGGLVTINADTAVQILKLAWSLCSVVRGTK